MDENQDIIDEANEAQKALGKDIKMINNRMKDILATMRTPGKLFMDIVFMVILCGLLGVFIYLAQKYFGSKEQLKRMRLLKL